MRAIGDMEVVGLLMDKSFQMEGSSNQLPPVKKRKTVKLLEAKNDHGDKEGDSLGKNQPKCFQTKKSANKVSFNEY